MHFGLSIRRRLGHSLFLFLVPGIAFSDGSLPEAVTDLSVSVSASPFTITSIAVAGTNLVLQATIPSGLTQVVLQTQTTLAGPWVGVGQLTVPTDAGEVVFTIPKPSTPAAFFRLSANGNANTSPLISEELQYVALPSLGENLDANGDAVFHFKGMVDGSDRIVITRQGALWDHVNWAWPLGSVIVNDHQWDPQMKNYLTTPGIDAFLPGSFSLESADLERIQGRDIIALERTNNALIVYLDDTPNGADTYEFKVHFHPVTGEAPKAPSSISASLKIAAQIDGSDIIRITGTEATWEHKNWSYPEQVTLNDVPWNPQLEPVRVNEGTNRFLPAGIDFSSARIVNRQGRDLATMWSDKKTMWIYFADNPLGADTYELEIQFGH